MPTTVETPYSEATRSAVRDTQAPPDYLEIPIPRSDLCANDKGPGPRLLTASTLKGDRIINLLDETLGHIEEIMIDTRLGRVAYAVMGSGGFPGLGERMFAIPWSALTLDPDRQCLVMDANKVHFDKAPGFDKNHWPSMADREWHDEVHTYHRATPYWS